MNLLRSSWATDRSLWRRFVIAFLCVAASTALKASLGEYIGARVPFVTFFPAVVLAALYGGLSGGLLGTALSGLAAAFWLEPVGRLTIQNPSDWVAMAVFLVSGALVSGVCEVMHRAQSRLLCSERQARLAEEQERETLQRYELLAQNSRDIILFIRRRDGRILEANEAAVLAYGYERGELLERTVHDLRVSEDRPLAESQMDSADTAGLLFETAHRRKDGSTFPVEVSSRGMEIHGERVLVSLIRDTSERRRAESVLRESEANMRAILDATKESVFLFNTDGRLMTINQTAAERLRRPADELIGKAMADVISPEIAAGRMVPLREAIASGQPVQYTDERDGITFDHCFYPVTDSEGHVHRVAVFSRDVTERIKAEAALRLSEEKFAAAFAANPAAVVLTRLDDGRLLEANETWVAMMGYSLEEAIGRSSTTLNLWADAEDRAQFVEQLLRTGSIRSQERRFRRKSGEVFVALLSAEVISVAGEKLVLSNVLDITERKRAEEALRKSEAVLSQAGLMAHLGAWEIECLYPGNPDANPLHWSDEVYRIFGYAPGSVAVSNAFFLRHVHPEDRDRIAERMAQAMEKKEAYSVEHRIVRPDGSERTVAEHAQIAYDAEGRPLRVSGAVQDITDQKQLEQLLRKQASALRAADSAKNQFLAMLAHELRNPLGAIANATTLIEMQTSGQERVRKPVEILNRQVGHTARLVDDLLDVSRITCGKFELRKELVDVVRVIERAVETVAPQMAVRQHAFTVDLAAGPIWAEADPARLEQIATNLLNNAAKYTDPGGEISLTLSVRGTEAEVRVDDNGTGISPEMLPHIFDLFAQEDRSLDRSKGGLGIGLTLVRSLVEMHGGTVSAHSHGPGMGSVFTVRLPILESAVEGAERPISVAETRKARILVVDDNLDAAQMLADLLEIAGHQVFLAHDGASAIEAVRTLRPDTVLLDIGLPGMDGYEVARHLRSSSDLTGTRLVALTGYGREEDRRRSMEAGFDHHLIKPVDMVKLKGVLAGEE